MWKCFNRKVHIQEHVILDWDYLEYKMYYKGNMYLVHIDYGQMAATLHCATQRHKIISSLYLLKILHTGKSLT